MANRILESDIILEYDIRKFGMLHSSDKRKIGILCYSLVLVLINVDIFDFEDCLLEQIDCGHQFIICTLVCYGMLVQFHF